MLVCLPRLMGLGLPHLAFYVGAVDLNSDSHAYTLPISPRLYMVRILNKGGSRKHKMA